MGASPEDSLTNMDEVLFTVAGQVQAYIAEGFIHIVALVGWLDQDFRAVAKSVLDNCCVGGAGSLPGWDYYVDNGSDHWILVLPDGNMTREDMDVAHP